ncbi:Serine arginine-rich splicing factor 2 [Homalodisca vitripennis]|nr:Serine arginine-rich splicing factor 2 [Homalodisca vitripennis]
MSYGRPPPRIDGMISLKVGNLTYRTTSDDLRRVFGKFGSVGDVYIPKDRFSRESRGFAFVSHLSHGYCFRFCLLSRLVLVCLAILRGLVQSV